MEEKKTINMEELKKDIMEFSVKVLGSEEAGTVMLEAIKVKPNIANLVDEMIKMVKDKFGNYDNVEEIEKFLETLPQKKAIETIMETNMKKENNEHHVEELKEEETLQPQQQAESIETQDEHTKADENNGTVVDDKKVIDDTDTTVEVATDNLTSDLNPDVKKIINDSSQKQEVEQEKPQTQQQVESIETQDKPDVDDKKIVTHLRSDQELKIDYDNRPELDYLTSVSVEYATDTFLSSLVYKAIEEF